VRLVGTDRHRIVNETLTLLNDEVAYQRMAFAHNPYGDGSACQRILKIFEELAKSAPT
jgi:UDP-N-acetylglucosamine 2-epimerase (non-hydrolysing)